MKVAVIGSGYWGKNLVRNFNQLGALAMVCDATETGRATAHQLAPNATITDDLEQALNANVQGIVIATPAETHHNLAARALQAGKDVFVEKPLALTYDQGAHLVQLAEQHQRILMVGHVLEYHPAINKLHQLIADNQLGKIRYIYSNRLSLGKIRREENILWSFAPHDIAVILRLTRQLPFQITATGGSYVTPNIADVTITNLLFDNGLRAHIFVSWLNPFKEQRLVIIGDKKMATFDDVNKQLTLHDQRVDIQQGQPTPIKGQGINVPYPNDEPLRLECQAFLTAINTRQPPLTNGHSGLQVLTVLQAAQRSLITNGEPIALPITNTTVTPPHTTPQQTTQA